MQVIVFPFLIPPQKSYETDVGTLRAIKAGEAEKKYGDFPLSVRPYEMEYFFKDRLDRLEYEESVWAVLELKRQDAYPHDYKGIFDLTTGNWDYHLRWLEYYNIMPIGDIEERPEPRRFRVTTRFLNSFNEISLLMNRERRFQFATRRWHRSYHRADCIDTVIDCCVALEALFKPEYELRLRMSLYAYLFSDWGKSASRGTVYEMYGIRNDFIHGKEVAKLTDEQRRRYVSTVARILNRCVKLQSVPDKSKLDKEISQRLSL